MRNIVYTQNNSKFKKVLKVILRVLLLLFLGFLIFLEYYIPKSSWYSQTKANYYSTKIFPYIARVFNSVTNVPMFSITETIVVVGSIMLVILVIYTIVMLIVKIVKGGFFNYLYKVVTLLLVVTMVGGLIFQAMHGLNYRRTPVEVQLDLVGKERTVYELMPAYNWAYEEMVGSRKQLGKDINGAVHMQTSFEESVYYANMLINTCSEYLDLELNDTYVRAKPVSLSHYWMYTNILGMYDPFIGEANVNVDCTLPYINATTIVHELLHAKGLARESDAELAAILMCCMADRPDFRYAGFLELYSNLYFELYAAGVKIDFDEGARTDLQAYNNYCDTFVSNDITEKVAEVSEATNNAFLESNEQEGGTDTYIINNNYYIEFFYNYVYTEKENDKSSD